MPAPTSTDELLDLVRKSGVVEEKRFDAALEKLRGAGQLPDEPAKLANLLVDESLLTHFQAEQLIQGKWRRFNIGKYRVLERIGSGGMGSVFLCEHKFMRVRRAVKVLPTAKAADPACLERFYREARAVAALDHPNIVHAYDIDQDETLHFIVMEYVDGPTFQDIVRRSGPLSLERACHYIRQAAEGLDHAGQASLVHRDIKPGNILVDRTGVVKILDMGLARFFNDEEDLLTRKYDENVLGTADYLAPEQADDSHAVDIRADIYSLGGTFHYLLTGKTPFGEGSIPQKLMWHRTRQPKPISAFRDDVPAEVQSIINKMMAKEPQNRYQTPAEICAALAPYTQTAIPPPPESELPQLSPAAASPSIAARLPASPSIAGADSDSGKAVWKAPSKPTASSPKSPAPSPKKSTSATTDPSKATKVGGGIRTPSPTSTPRAAGTMAIKPPPLPSPKTAPTRDDDRSHWASPGSDTMDAAARGDTPPLTSGKRRLATKPRSTVAHLGSKVNLKWLAAAGIATVAGLLIFVLIRVLI